jgi:hypothetical protein
MLAMTTQDLTTIAHAAGTAGRSWEQFQGDDAVQAYVCANDDYENHIEAWRAAWQTGTIQHLTARGWVSRWTTAPTDYDCFGTLTAELCGDWYGKPLRRRIDVGFGRPATPAPAFPTPEPS